MGRFGQGGGGGSSSRFGGGGGRESLDAAVKEQGGFLGNLGSDIADVLFTAPRAFYEMGKAPITDIAQVPGNLLSEATGGDPDWQLDTWTEVLDPWLTESMPRTLDVIAGPSWELAKGVASGEPIEGFKKGWEEQKEHAQDFYEKPASFTLEHLGNVALVGSVASRPLGMAASRTAGRAGTSGSISSVKKAARATRKADRRAGMKPSTSPRRARQHALREIADEGGAAGKLAKSSLYSQNLVGHPYQAALSKAVNARVPGLGGLTTAEGTPQGPIGARGGRSGARTGAVTGAVTGGFAGGPLGVAAGGLAGATLGTLASARRAGAKSQSLGSLTRQVTRPRNAPEAAEFSPTAQAIRGEVQRVADSEWGQQLGQSKFVGTGRGVRRAGQDTSQAINEARSKIRQRFDTNKARQRAAKGINQRRRQLREAGVDLPDDAMRGAGIQWKLERDPAEMGRVMDDVERVNRQRREAGQDPIEIPGMRDLDWKLTRVREAERAGDFAEGELQRLVTRKAQLDNLADPHSEVQRLAREYGEQQGMTPEQINQTLRQSMSTELMQTEGGTSYSQLDPELRRIVDEAAETWRGWQRSQEAEVVKKGLLDPRQAAVRTVERKPTTRVVRDAETGDIRFDMDPDQIELGGRTEAVEVDQVPQYVADQHRRVQRLRQQGADTAEIQKAERDLARAEDKWAKEQPTNTTFEPVPTEEAPAPVNVPPGEQARAALQRRGLLVERLEGQTSKRREKIRESRVAHQAEAMDRYNELHAELRTREKAALKKDPETPEGQQAWDQYARAYEQLDAFENELVLASVGGRPKPMRNTAAAISDRLERILYIARNSDEFAPGTNELAALNEALGELEKVQATLPEVGPILALIGREGVSGGSPELRSLHRAAEANPRLAETPEFQQALSYASSRTSKRGYEQIAGTGRQQRALQRGQRAQRQGREALSREIEGEVLELGRLVEKYKEQARPFEQKLAKTQSKARAQLQDLAEHERRLERARRAYDEFREGINQRLEATPKHYRPALRFARDEAPELDRMLREDFEVPHEIVDDLDLQNLPQTLTELHDAGVNVTYVHTMETDDLGRTQYSGKSPELSETQAKRFKRARNSGNIFAEDQPGVLIPAQQMQMVQQMLHNDMVKFVEQKFAKSPEQVMKDAGYSQERIDELMTEARGRTVYDEAGNLTEYRKPQPHVLEHEMKKLGFADLQTNQKLKPLRRQGTRAPEGKWMPEKMGTIVANAMSPTNLERSLRTFYDPLMGMWKASVLAMRPAWHVYNIYGGAFMSLIGGGTTPAELVRYLPDAWRARRRWGRGEPTEVGGLGKGAAKELFDESTSIGPYRRDIRSIEEGLTPGKGIRGALAQTQTAQRLGEGRAAQGRPGQLTKKVATEGGNILGRVVEGSFRLNSFFDHVFRTTTYLAQLERGSSSATAIRMAKKTIGDYTTMSPFQRSVVRRVFPFWAWTRHISKLTARQLTPGNIDRFSIYASLMQAVGEPNALEEMLPGYASGDIHVGETEEGEPIFMGMSGINPFADVTAPIMFGGGFSFRGTMKMMSPAVTLPLSRMTGIDPLTMQPYSRPYPEVDEEGREIPTAPPIHQQLIELFPQARYAQQVARRASGETLARYGSDDPVLISGADDRSILGEGAQLLGASVRPMDVRNMQSRRSDRWERALRQKQRYQAELEQYRNSEESQSPLRDLPFIP